MVQFTKTVFDLSLVVLLQCRNICQPSMLHDFPICPFHPFQRDCITFKFIELFLRTLLRYVRLIVIQYQLQVLLISGIYREILSKGIYTYNLSSIFCVQVHTVQFKMLEVIRPAVLYQFLAVARLRPLRRSTHPLVGIGMSDAEEGWISIPYLSPRRLWHQSQPVNCLAHLYRNSPSQADQNTSLLLQERLRLRTAADGSRDQSINQSINQSEED